MSFAASSPLSAEFRAAVTGVLTGFLEAQRSKLTAISPELDVLVELALDYSSGGKRFRPAGCFWAFQGSTDELPDWLLPASSALDLLHVSALVHDDLMDCSATRRGLPSAHIRLAELHRERGLAGDAERFGGSGAVLLGNLLWNWGDELLRASGAPDEALDRAQPYLAALRTEVNAGQYLDVLAGGTDVLSHSPAELLSLVETVVEFKTSMYTVTRPLQIGAALAANPQPESLAAYGRPLGRAFQYRDDILGVFGDPEVTGKPAGDDLREGKITALIAHTVALTDEAGRKLLADNLGDPELSAEAVAGLQTLIRDCGALERVEESIQSDYQATLGALDTLPLNDTGKEALGVLARAAVERES
ncbi:MAG: polyprenyl synthetase family protein [Propionibacteriaceae bacterium]|nr:polyprenyl synthetase family protein [Propionibacteriaceae bacterium]